MSGELVFRVAGSAAVEAEPISLAEAGLKERAHLQEWVIAHPKILGDDFMIVAFEYGRWASSTGSIERDRLDVLGLDREGRLVVVELKRDRAPDTIDMQALKYAALVSRFTLDELAKVHARYLSIKRGEQVDPEAALAELEEWAEISEDSLRLPKLVLMATSFPPTVTATVVFLHQQLGLDVRLLAFQAYRTENDVLVTVSQHYPPPDIEEFVLSPEVNEVRNQRTQRQTRARELTTTARLIDAGVLEIGQRLEFRAPSEPLQAEIEPWLAEDERRRWATWTDDNPNPLQWEFDGQLYTPTGIARRILEQASGRSAQVQGPLYWVDDEGRSLVELAADLPASGEVPLDVHLEKQTPEIRALFTAVDGAIMNLGGDVHRASRARSIKYYATKKLCDVLVHQDHISVYLRGLDEAECRDSPVFVGITRRYVHAKVRSLDEVDELRRLLSLAYDKQNG